MKIEWRTYNSTGVITLQGELNGESVKQFQDAASSLVAADVAGIVLDMSRVTFIDSSGLEEMLWLKDYCQENNRQVKLAGLDEVCHKILEITRLLQQFDTYTGLAGAVKSFA